MHQKVMQNLTIENFVADHIVNSIIAFTMSLLLFFRALTALDRDTLAWDITSSMSLSSTPSSSTSSSSSSSGMAGCPPKKRLKIVHQYFHEFYEFLLKRFWCKIQKPGIVVFRYFLLCLKYHHSINCTYLYP